MSSHTEPSGATHFFLPDEPATIAFGQRLAAEFLTRHQRAPHAVVTMHLFGELGAGKSSLARALLRALGVTGAIKSPTYALMEPYDSAHGTLLHLDLYRLSDPGELDYLGLDSALGEAALCLIEWPEKAAGRLPSPEFSITLRHGDDPHGGRTLVLETD
jgi:tRNA threonylcarbamoyladenosine biosynthesis protein TsaE